MYIKQISIQGFKSYKNQTNVEPFSPRHNVVVGRNGSGKSNFFAAVRFVLGDAYTQMSREERQALLHEGTGSATMTAFVEVVFDNSDRRFPNGSDELILRRTIGQKKDEYSLDRKNATRKDVMSMLESAGFSRSNPYYIVPQGRVTALTNMKDSDRLNLLKEVAGTQVYESRRQESRKIMEDTDSKRAKIDDLMQFIGERLTELEEEKEELKGYQEKDREKRCLEHTIFARDKEEITMKLEELENLQNNGTQITDRNQEEFIQREQQLEQIEQRINDVQQQIKFLEIDKKQYDQERKAAAREKARIELELKASRDNEVAAQSVRHQKVVEQTELEEQIREREDELNNLLPQYETTKAQEQKARHDFAASDGRRQILAAKQGRHGQFGSKAERDQWLQSQIDSTNRGLATQKAVLMDANEDLRDRKERIASTEAELAQLRDRLNHRGSDAQDLAAEIQGSRDECDQLQDKRKELRRDEARLSSTISHVQQELQKAERGLSQLMDRNTSRGVTAVRRIVKQHDIDGLHGMLAELFEPHEHYRTAAEVTAGTSLFHFVVDTDETASKILEILQREKAGRVTFIPLNRIRSRPTTLPKANDAVPLLSKLRFDEQFEPAFQQVFGKTIVCPSLQIASQYARSHGVGAITPDGDRADKKGALTGGYHDNRRSRLQGVKTVAKWSAEYDEVRMKLDDITKQCDRLDQQITRAIGNLQKAEQKKQQSESGYGPLMIELRAKTTDLQTQTEELEALQRRRSHLEAGVQRASQDVAAYQSEKSSDFRKALTNAEEAELSTITSDAQRLRKSLADSSKQLSELELRKTELEVQLRENLRPRLDQSKADDAEGAGAQSDDLTGTLQHTRTLQRVSEALNKATNETAKVDGDLDTARGELASHQDERNLAQEQQKELAAKMHKQQKAIDKSASKRALYTSQMQEVSAKLRGLGVVPEAAFHSPYANMRYESALKRYHKIQEELKKFGHVNKKAFEQYNSFTRQRESLTERREELQTSSESITDLISTLDLRKDEAIERTFKQVSQEFSRVFEKLVPAGRGILKIQRRADTREQDVDEEDDERRKSGVENYLGVSIQVSFNSKHDEQQKIQQLSGGQKSLCALALVFAIQASDPAPFYLFDEIDANLDAQYRTSVAQMLHESSDTAQFICTTFRPEMLHVADKCYGVGYERKASSIGPVSKEDALRFVEGQIGGK